MGSVWLERPQFSVIRDQSTCESAKAPHCSLRVSRAFFRERRPRFPATTFWRFRHTDFGRPAGAPRTLPGRTRSVPGRAPELCACADRPRRRAAPRRRRGHFRDLSASPSGPRSSARARRSLFASTDQSPRIQRSEPVRTPRPQVRGCRGERLALLASPGLASRRISTRGEGEAGA